MIEIVGCTRSWDRPANPGQFLVIADNMMNLELLLKVWKLTGNMTYYDMAVSHANRTLMEHVREDGSSFQVVAFNETNGKVTKKYTAHVSMKEYIRGIHIYAPSLNTLAHSFQSLSKIHCAHLGICRLVMLVSGTGLAGNRIYYRL